MGEGRGGVDNVILHKIEYIKTQEKSCDVPRTFGQDCRILFTLLLDCDLTNPGKEQAPICLSAAFMWHACLSHIYKYFGQAGWFLVLYVFDRQDKNVILIM